MKEEVSRVCNVVVQGDKDFKDLVEEAISSFMDSHLDKFFLLGYLRSVKIDINYKVMEKK